MTSFFVLTLLLLFISLTIVFWFRLLVRFLVSPRALEETEEVTRARVLGRRFIQVWIFQTPFLEAFSFSHLGKVHIYIADDLWNSLEASEKESLCLWLSLSASRSHFLFRLAFAQWVKINDRDTLLALNHEKLFSQTLTKVSLQESRSLLGEWFAGLGMLGPSLFQTWPSLSERLQNRIAR